MTPLAPNDDLLPLTGSVTSYSTLATTHCGRSVGRNSLTGVVSAVADGDTLTVAGTAVRLDSIDAPEISQTYGSQSKSALQGLALNKFVTVYYAKKDRYGRVVGSVFSDCTLINLEQVRSGSAWYYQAYQCEISASARNEYAAAQAAAQAADRGLWAYTATAPWVYRNGVEPAIPACSSTLPTWSSTPSAPLVGSSTPPATPAPAPPTVAPTQPTSCALVWVNGYYRDNGTHVRGYYRRKPGC
ncbi:thermonuclease family protein [Ottowia sp.]|uniref:thermonuclease family protein n=1 Tax=Ottowia sp. TaxID=1898956 RepID=UPI002B734E53|nr:thermonuclease family protein [Ottowia sp.]HOB68045.1 thermonuclease family protein [Ottowia sp.]HPZ58788.1 thermonuclease family protein [Ottowia sp.]HQD46863.1 thermonuclease family protein [Ottowia sp.]